jgi:hypothetical protein
MIAPRVQIYVQPTPYTIGEMMPGSYVTMTTRQGHELISYRVGDTVQIGVARDAWPVNVSVGLPGFRQFNCKIEQFQNLDTINSGGNLRDPFRLPR